MFINLSKKRRKLRTTREAKWKFARANGEKAVPTDDAGNRISTQTTFFITTFIKTYPDIEICFAFGAFILLCNNFIWFFISHIMTFTFLPPILRQDPIQFVHVMTSSKFLCCVSHAPTHSPGKRNQSDFPRRLPLVFGAGKWRHLLLLMTRTLNFPVFSVTQVLFMTSEERTFCCCRTFNETQDGYEEAMRIILHCAIWRKGWVGL